MSLYKKLFLVSVISFVYVRSADQDLGPRYLPAKRPALERSLPDSEISTSEAKRQKTGEALGPKLGLLSVSDAVAYELEQQKETIISGTKFMSLESIDKERELFIGIKNFVSAISPEIKAVCNEIHGTYTNALAVATKQPSVQRSISEGGIALSQTKIVESKNGLRLQSVFDAVEKSLVEQIKKMISGTDLTPLESIERDEKLLPGIKQFVLRTSPAALQACKDIDSMLTWQKNCREYPHTFFSTPRDTRATKLSTYLTGLIHHAKDEIKMAVYHLTFFPVARALVERKKAGITVTLLTNSDQGGPVEAANYMKKQGVDIFVPKATTGEMFKRSIHTKFFIFKNILGKKLVVTGSYNPTGNADENEWNDLNISNTDKTFDQYEEQFLNIKKNCYVAPIFTANKPISPYSYKLNDVPNEERKQIAPNPVNPANRIQPEKAQPGK